MYQRLCLVPEKHAVERVATTNCVATVNKSSSSFRLLASSYARTGASLVSKNIYKTYLPILFTNKDFS